MSATLCPYCGYEFETLTRLWEHVPCPDDIGDTHPDFGVPEKDRKDDRDHENPVEFTENHDWGEYDFDNDPDWR